MTQEQRAALVAEAEAATNAPEHQQPLMREYFTRVINLVADHPKSVNIVNLTDCIMVSVVEAQRKGFLDALTGADVILAVMNMTEHATRIATVFMELQANAAGRAKPPKTPSHIN